MSSGKFEEINYLVRSAEVSLFIGSGLSLKAGAPSVSNLVNSLARLFPKGYKKGLRYLPLDDIASEYVKHCQGNRAPLTEFLRKKMNFRRKDLSDPQELSRIPHFRNIFTTNYDTLLEDCYPSTETKIVRCNADCSLSDKPVNIYKVHGDFQLIKDTYKGLKEIYAAWESDHRDPNGLFWQMDGRDGMEVSISGAMSDDATGYRATINSYMYADAMALSSMAEMLGKSLEATVYKEKADEIKVLMDRYLWDEDARFYKVIPRNGKMMMSPAREEHGYVPWIYDIPGESKSEAWLQLVDEQGFKAPYGPTTAERRADGFKVVYEGHECQWNGPSWPFATAQTLTGLAAFIHRYGEGVMTKNDYYETLTTFSNSHRRVNDKGKKICWIDENLDPFTGEWISRKMLIAAGSQIKERGKDYNHSSFCDLVISGLLGLQPQVDGSLVIEPLIPEGKWDYFCLDGIVCAGRNVVVLYDKDGSRYGKGTGFRVFVDGKEAFKADTYTTKAIV